MCSADFWNHTGFQNTDQPRSRGANDSAESSTITTEKRYERSTEFWNRTASAPYGLPRSQTDRSSKKKLPTLAPSSVLNNRCKLRKILFQDAHHVFEALVSPWRGTQVSHHDNGFGDSIDLDRITAKSPR